MSSSVSSLVKRIPEQRVQYPESESATIVRSLLSSLVDTIAKTESIKEQFFSEIGLPMISSIDKGGLLPENCRFSSAFPLMRAPSCQINPHILENLHLSGSAQFTQASLKTLIKRIRDLEGQVPIAIVSLKREKNLQAFSKEGTGSVAFSYLKPLISWLEPLTLEEIEQRERSLAASLSGKKLTLYGVVDSIDPRTLTKDAHTITHQLSIDTREVRTERELVEREGASFFRIIDRKFGHIDWEHVDQFVDTIRRLPENTHVHICCRRGMSRTTLYMALYTIMKKADIASADEIMAHQGPSVLGGVELANFKDTTAWDYAFKSAWSPFLHHFHQYVLENKSTNFEKPWSVWAQEKGQEKGIERPSCQVLDQSYKGASIESLLPAEEEIETREKPLVLNFLDARKVLPQNLRFSQGMFVDLEHHPRFSSTGLSDMKVLGCSQYSESSFSLLMQKLKKMDPEVKLHVFDLNKYPQVLINGLVASQSETNAEFIQDTTPEAVIENERALKREIEQKRGVRLLAIDTQYPLDTFKERFSVETRPERVETPQEMVSRNGASYHRIPTKRFSEISEDSEVDFLTEYVRSIDEHTYTLFHCKMGKSRTTLYECMFDILHNADRVPMEAIVERQHIKGGINLFDVTPLDPTWAYEKQGKIDRISFLARFHEYAKSVFIPAKTSGQRAQLWSEWSREHTSFQPDISHLIVDTSR